MARYRAGLNSKMAARFKSGPARSDPIECSIHECSLNGKDNDLSYYLIHLGPFCIGELCLFQLFP